MYTGKLPSTLIGWRRSTARPITRDFWPGGPAWTTPLQRLDHFDTIQVLRNGPLRYTIVWTRKAIASLSPASYFSSSSANVADYMVIVIYNLVVCTIA